MQSPFFMHIPLVHPLAFTMPLVCTLLKAVVASWLNLPDELAGHVCTKCDSTNRIIFLIYFRKEALQGKEELTIVEKEKTNLTRL